MESHKNEIIVTIVCAFFVAVTAVMSSLIARKTLTTYQIKLVPSFQNVETTDYFPLRVGNTWEYVGTARNDTVQKEVIENKVSVKMSVTNVIQSDNAKLFMMKGHPLDAAWFLKPGDNEKSVVEAPSSRYGYLVISNKVFFIPSDRLVRVKNSIEERGFLKPNLITQDDLRFEFPLFRGLVFGSPNQIARSDRSYSWHVTDSTLYHAAGKQGINEVGRYKLVNLRLPDYTEISFVPYVGIVSFSYSHHGTTAQVDVDLKDYHVHVDR